MHEEGRKMDYKSIMTVWYGGDSGRPAFDLAARFAEAGEGHLNVLCLGIDRIQPGLYYAGASPAILADGIQAARQAARTAEEEARTMLEGADFNWSLQTTVVQISGIAFSVGTAARYNDLVILPRPYGTGLGEEAGLVLEAALFDGRAPVLVCPPEYEVKPADLPGHRILIAWNQSTEALAAIRGALPLIRSSEAVEIAIIDPPEHEGDRADPGVELSRMLARHGANVTVNLVPRTVTRTAEQIQILARDFGADLIVMGAYGHSRFRESILGGATRDMLEDVEIPVLMGH